MQIYSCLTHSLVIRAVIKPVFFLLPQSLHSPVGGDDPAERVGHQEPGGDSQRAGDHQPGHAERAGRGHRPLGCKGAF